MTNYQLIVSLPVGKLKPKADKMTFFIKKITFLKFKAKIYSGMMQDKNHTQCFNFLTIYFFAAFSLLTTLVVGSIVELKVQTFLV